MGQFPDPHTSAGMTFKINMTVLSKLGLTLISDSTVIKDPQMTFKKQ